MTTPIPVRPVVHYMMGGVDTDIHGATEMPGLYAAGEVACVSINGAPCESISTLVATGDVVLVFRDGTAFDAITGQDWVFEVATFHSEVKTWLEATQATPNRAARPVRTGAQPARERTA